jgi:hypothetical protein
VNSADTAEDLAGRHRHDDAANGQPEEKNMAHEKVVFVCLHGAAKSVIAAELFNRRSSEAGLPARAVALGLEPDPAISPAAAAGLLAEADVARDDG